MVVGFQQWYIIRKYADLQTSATPPVVHQSHSHWKCTFISINDIGAMRHVFKIFQGNGAPGHWWTGLFSLRGWGAAAHIALGASFYLFIYFPREHWAQTLKPAGKPMQCNLCRVHNCLKIENVILHFQTYTNLTQQELHGCEELTVFVVVWLKNNDA